MHTHENTTVSRGAILDYDHFRRLPGGGLTEDRFSQVAVDEEGCRTCIDLIIGFLSNITHDLSRAQCGLDSWQPAQVDKAADTIYQQCVRVGANRAGGLAMELKQSAQAHHPRECRKIYKTLRSELIFVWQDLQGRLQAIRLDLALHDTNPQRVI